jgi:hypothetical protein
VAIATAVRALIWPASVADRRYGRLSVKIMIYTDKPNVSVYQWYRQAHNVTAAVSNPGQETTDS